MLKVAKVALPISLDREFDYLVPCALRVKKGTRVLVDFNNKKRLGLVMGLSKTSKYKKLKTILNVFDVNPLLKESHMRFAKRLSFFYPYSKADFLFMMLPPYLKKLKKVDLKNAAEISEKKEPPKRIFTKANSFSERYLLWRDAIREKLKKGSVLICFPQLSYLKRAKQCLQKDFPNKLIVMYSQQKQKELFLNWTKSRKNTLILGSRVSIFYYPYDLKLIIVEEENNLHYFQKEKPFHNLVDVAELLAKTKGADLILSGDYPSLATYKLIKKNKMNLYDKGCPSKRIEVISTFESSKRRLIGPVLTEFLQKALKEQKKAVVLWNRKGFARFISCSACGYAFKCEHCSGFLQLSQAEGARSEQANIERVEGVCPYCQRRVQLPKICSQCNNGYIKIGGYGIERVESLLRRIFPEAKICNLDKQLPDCKIILSTSKILRYLYEPCMFDRGFLLDIDILLARTDYDTVFNAFFYLKKLSFLFKDNLYVFTRNKNYYLFKHLNEEWRNFYEFELKCRKSLSLPPLGLIAKITLRAKNKNMLLKRVNDLYNRLQKKFKDAHGPFEEHPFKLRDKFRYSIVIKTKRNFACRNLIKEEIKSFRTTGVQLAVVLR